MDSVDPLTAYHQLFEVERSFRMSKTDLRARPMISHVRDSIEAHLTMVLAALAVSRSIQDRTGLSIRRFVRTLLPLRAAQINIGGHHLTVRPWQHGVLPVGSVTVEVLVGRECGNS